MSKIKLPAHTKTIVITTVVNVVAWALAKFLARFFSDTWEQAKGELEEG